MDEMADYRPQWEHHIEYIKARGFDPKLSVFLSQYYPKQAIPECAVEATLPRLNEIGAQGWELVHMQPVEVGVNGDIRTAGQMNYWTDTYLCVFKRLKRSAQL